MSLFSGDWTVAEQGDHEFKETEHFIEQMQWDKKSKR